MSDQKPAAFNYNDYIKAMEENASLQAQLDKAKAERDAAREFACAYCRIIPCRKNKCPCWGGPLPKPLEDAP